MIDGINRTVLLLLGLVLIAAGAAGIAIDQGVLPVPDPSAFYRAVAASVAASPVLWWTLIIVAAVLVTILGLVYALRQLVVQTGPRLGTILLNRHPRGVTRLAPSAVSAAVARDLGRLEGVQGSRVQLTSFRPQPHLRVRLDVDDRADLERVHARADEAFRRLCRTLGVDGVDVDLYVRLRPTESARVE